MNVTLEHNTLILVNVTLEHNISQKQKSVATSMTETEYMALFMCAKTDIWLTQMLQDMSLEKYLEGNLHCISIQESEVHRQNSPLQLKEDN